MIGWKLDRPAGTPLKILCLGAHSDDIEIGCGGTVLRLLEEHPDCELHWVVFSAAGARGDEARRGAQLFGGSQIVNGPLLKEFPDGFLPYVGADVKAAFETLKPVAPDVIFTHSSQDAHQDHRLLCELTWNTFRDHQVFEYEIPKYDGDMGRPNVFVPLAAPLYEKKVAHLMDTFGTQRSKRWFQPETFLSLMRLRGMECNSPSGYAEAFYCRKLVL
jgi:LmbE family N-acetylglucosaminyl deacetylase